MLGIDLHLERRSIASEYRTRSLGQATPQGAVIFDCQPFDKTSPHAPDMADAHGLETAPSAVSLPSFSEAEGRPSTQLGFVDPTRVRSSGVGWSNGHPSKSTAGAARGRTGPELATSAKNDYG